MRNEVAPEPARPVICPCCPSVHPSDCPCESTPWKLRGCRLHTIPLPGNHPSTESDSGRTAPPKNRHVETHWMPRVLHELRWIHAHFCTLYFSNTKTYFLSCGQPKKDAILSFYDLGLRVGPSPSKQTTKPYSFAELPGRKEERRRAFQV